jgi:hypothetical protein
MAIWHLAVRSGARLAVVAAAALVGACGVDREPPADPRFYRSLAQPGMQVSRN